MHAVSELASSYRRARRDRLRQPGLIPGAAGETEIAGTSSSGSRAPGSTASSSACAPPSVIATARGSGGGRTLLLNAHLDTVGTEAMDAPFDARVEDGRLYGRGSYDMKGALAAAMLAAADGARLGLPGDVVLTAVADEEVASVGTEEVLEHVRADAAIVCEPTELQVAVAHRGFAGFEIETAASPHTARVRTSASTRSRRWAPCSSRWSSWTSVCKRAPAPARRHGSLHASLIEGGQEFSSYPERCLLTGERRTLPGETIAEVERELRAAAGDARGAG